MAPQPLPEMDTGSRLERVLRSGRFAITAEMEAPDSADPQAVLEAAEPLLGVADAINATDASGANVHMSSMAICALLARAGHEPVLQMAARDRNRIAMQGDLVGASALGIHNVLCLTGDDVTAGDQPEARPVYDFDSLHLLRTARILRDQGVFLSGRAIETPPRYFLGAASNPFAQPFDYRPQRLAKKIEAGAQFIQTQLCFDVPRFRTFMEQVRDMGLHEKVYILAGVGTVRSERVAEFMRTQVPGIRIPDEIVDRLRRTPKEKKAEESKRIAVEIIQQILEIEGIAGLHIMAYRQEKLVPEILEEAGVRGG